MEFCREQGIAFTDTDKVMYNLQTSKKLHYILKKFFIKNTQFLEKEQEELDADFDVTQLGSKPKKVLGDKKQL